ncbi:MAG TPA: hypothetical protein VFD31_08075 [Thermoleophilaceae bacterium]|nr:hypothetical protein [Thermoleophilaceae bacterium]
MRCERGQATIEWVGLVLLASLALGALATAVPVIDGRSFGGFLSHRILCAIKGRCSNGDQALARAHGPPDAELLRRYAPELVYEPGERQLPVDFRTCRARECSDAPDDPDLDAHRSATGEQATAFTNVVHRGGRTYLQYFFYYPDSNSTFAGSDIAWNNSPLRFIKSYPGFHLDDWEGYGVRLDRDGGASVRSTSHGHHQYCKQAECENEWGPRTGWTRVSRGSHAGHIPLDRRVGRPASHPRARPGSRAPRERTYEPQIPGVNLRERTTTGDGLRLIPLEEVKDRPYRRLEEHIKPPWQKSLYRDPESPES